ncbi:hypothetical protein D9M72_462250 [compost metagenome]
MDGGRKVLRLVHGNHEGAGAADDAFRIILVERNHRTGGPDEDRQSVDNDPALQGISAGGCDGQPGVVVPVAGKFENQ